MDKYTVRLLSHAERDLDSIYAYIAQSLLEPQIALSIVEAIEEGILSLETMPNRYPKRNRGIYKNKNYRQLLVKNYMVVYKVDEQNKSVIIVTVRFAGSQF